MDSGGLPHADGAVLVAMAVFHGKVAVVALSSLGFGMMDLMLPSAWALCLAIGGRLSGTATGMMNTAGQAGGFLCTVLFGYIVHCDRQLQSAALVHRSHGARERRRFLRGSIARNASMRTAGAAARSVEDCSLPSRTRAEKIFGGPSGRL